MAVVEDRDVVAELLAEGEDEPSEAAVDMEPDPVAQCDLGHRLDGVDGPVAVVARRSDDGHGVGIDVAIDPVGIDLGGDRIDRSHLQLDPEQMAGLVERRVRRLRLDHVRPVDPAVPGRVFAVGQHGVADAPGPARGHQTRRLAVGDRVGVQEVEGHGDDLGLELGGTGADVALEHVHVGEHAEGLVHEPVVVVVSAVHGARALARFPRGIFLGGHGPELVEDLRARRALLGKVTVHGEAPVVGEGAHGGDSLAGFTLLWGACWLHGTRHR